MLWLCLWLLGAAHAATEPFLLPGSAAPAHYDVRLLFDVDPATNFSFYGVVDILLTAKKSTSELVLHAQDYSIVSEAVTLEGDRAPKVLDTRLNNTYNFLTVKLNDKLTPGQNYSLKIPFHGNLKPALEGVYISSYIDSSTKKKQFLVTTQFEATHARRGFPCFDEPIHKATFTITIGHRRDYTAISNMPLKTSTRENALADSWDWKKIETTFKKPQSEFVFDEFEKSVPMSTYLVAFVVSNFLYKDSPAGLSNTKFRIWARKDAIDQTTYASEIGPKVLSYFEKFFNVSFPLPKQDMIALPDFSAGAMENWGLITYRETALLYDKEQSSSMNKERVVEVIAHELAHQWFGNLVTMKWWSDLWLNEGFATFAASLGMSAVAPEWRSDDNNAVDHIMSVFALDSLESSHPVVVPIDDPKRISEIFDEISYRKGSTLIRMMVKFLGEDVFRKALNSYLVKYSYSNAQQDDLWAEFTKASEMYSGGLSRNVTVKRIMDTWTTQTGYPVVTVKRDYDDKTLTVMQKRFTHLGSRGSTALSWWVPLRVLCASEADGPEQPVEWLADDEGVRNEHKFEHGAEANEWVLFNPDMIAPYRINYDARNWELLIKTLNSDRYTAVPKLGRVQLLLDAFAFAWNNQLDYSVAFNLAAYLDRETEYLPLNTGMSQLQRLHLVLRRTSDYGIFLKYIRKLIQPRYEQAGGLTKKMIVNGDDLNSVKMQVLTSMWACRAKVTNCEDNAIDMFKEWMQMSDPDANNPIPLDLRRTVYCVAIARGSVAEFRFALARMQRANVAAARATLQHALSCTNVVWILKQYLEWTITEGSQEVRPQDAARVIADITSSTVGYYVAKDFIYTRIKDIHETFRSGQSKRLGAVLKTLLGQFTTQQELDEFLKWKEENAKYLADFKLSVSQAVEASRVNIQWLEKNRKIIVDRIRAQTP